MGTIDGGTLALVVGLGLGAVALIFFGIANIRAGTHTRMTPHPNITIPWNRQPRILLGLNNIVFALLLLFIVLLILFGSDPTMRTISIVLILITLVLSMFLVVRGVMATMSMTTMLYAARRSDQTTTEAGEQPDDGEKTPAKEE